MERALRVYALYVPLQRAHFWASIFFLYFSARFDVAEVLALEAVYYSSVVLLEVPSGYLSDRVGRVPTLRISAAAGVLACLLFLVGGDRFVLFAAAQFSIAVCFSFVSGTDAAWHYDTLVSLGKGEEFAAREARLQRNGLLAKAGSGLVGGAVGVFDLRLAYALSLGAAVLAFATTLRLREPPHEHDAFAAEGFVRQLGACVRELRRPLLAWLFAYVVLQTTLEHVPYEFAQPYVAAVLGESVVSPGRTPLLTGVVTASIAAVGAFAAGLSLGLRRRFGTFGALLCVTALQVGVIGAMASGIHAAVLPLIALRSVHPAVSQVLVRAEVTPRLPRSLRATFLSLQSLVGRLGFSGVLLALGAVAGAAHEADADVLRRVLAVCFVLGAAGLAALLATRRAERA